MNESFNPDIIQQVFEGARRNRDDQIAELRKIQAEETDDVDMVNDQLVAVGFNGALFKTVDEARERIGIHIYALQKSTEEEQKILRKLQQG